MVLQLHEAELPDHGAVAEALIQLLYARGNRALTASEAYRLLADHFNLDWKQLLVRRNTKDTSRWHNICQSARNHLVKGGAMNRLRRDCWTLTDRLFKARGMTLEELGL